LSISVSGEPKVPLIFTSGGRFRKLVRLEGVNCVSLIWRAKSARNASCTGRSTGELVNTGARRMTPSAVAQKAALPAVKGRTFTWPSAMSRRALRVSSGELASASSRSAVARAVRSFLARGVTTWKLRLVVSSVA